MELVGSGARNCGRGGPAAGAGSATGATAATGRAAAGREALTRVTGTGRASRLATENEEVPISNGRWGGAGTAATREPGIGAAACGTNGRVAASMTLEGAGAGWPSWRSVAINTRSSDPVVAAGPTYSTRTRATPNGRKPSSSEVFDETSMTRSLAKGPRSLTRTMMERRLVRLVTRTYDGSGSVGCAAEIEC